MGCGKSKHDVVTGNTTRIKKPSEAESVKGKENETIKRQESCRCRKTNDISAVVSGDQPETNVETNSKKPKEKEDGGDCSEAVAVEMTNGDKQPEENETTTTFPPVAEVAAIVPENVVTEETVNDVNENESVSPVEEQKEKIDIETVVEEEKSIEDTNDEDVETEIASSEVAEPLPEVQTPVTTKLEVQDIPTTENDEIAATENNDIMATENDEIPVLKDEDKVDVVEENPADITKVVESA
ncbi:hypothetical protein ISN45_Aa07g027200 [Arabidopsis thaliana x Arabidopsis arenosa]|uniref:Uncharacterized protein n=1 Tax=Arabidopsis thaliana x Arabidopsis arenosa TaxID=1240361 RepID=A0A8T1Y979_9BRAS|nr:hypothetical protein ISN45_Aa07g027200 [Arabidopsis thaliana x Arabidopsis arenosa]